MGKRRLANKWRPVFLWIPRRVVKASTSGDEVEIYWVWGKSFRRYCVFQGRFMSVIYSKSDK